jgi:hypothetical protein
MQRFEWTKHLISIMVLVDTYGAYLKNLSSSIYLEHWDYHSFAQTLLYMGIIRLRVFSYFLDFKKSFIKISNHIDEFKIYP